MACCGDRIGLPRAVCCGTPRARRWQDGRDDQPIEVMLVVKVKTSDPWLFAASIPRGTVGTRQNHEHCMCDGFHGILSKPSGPTDVDVHSRRRPVSLVLLFATVGHAAVGLRTARLLVLSHRLSAQSSSLLPCRELEKFQQRVR